MSRDGKRWLSNGQGAQPDKLWSFTTDAPLVGMAFALESRDTLAADDAGGLYRLAADGSPAALSRSFHDLNLLACDDLGRRGAAVCESRRLVCFDRKLHVEWTVELPARATALDVESHGEYLAVALENGKCVVYDASHQRIFHFEANEPLGFLRFRCSQRGLLGATEFGRVALWDFRGDKDWSKSLKINIGGLTTAGENNAVALAGFTEGVKWLDAEGRRKGSYLLEGTPHLVSASFTGNRLAAATLEGHLYWLDADGELISGAELPEEAIALSAGALGERLVIGLATGRVFCLGWD